MEGQKSDGGRCNHTDFVFLKLLRQDHPLYARSKQFILEQVLQILKRLAGIVAQL
jgi:hypothetical protein